MTSSRSRLLSAGFWLGWVLAVLIMCIAGYLLLFACGITLFAHTISWCPQSGPSDYARLEKELRVLEGKAVSTLLCQPPAGGRSPVGTIAPSLSPAGTQGTGGGIGGSGATQGAAAPGPVSGGGAPPTETGPGPAGHVAPDNGQGIPPGAADGTPGPGSASGSPSGNAPGLAAPASGDQPSGQLPPGTPPAAAPLDNGPPAAEAPAGQAPEGPTPTTPAPDAPVDQEAAAGTPDCSGTSASPQTVRDLLLVLDHSKSMALPADANATEIEGLEHIIETGRASEVMKANRKYNQLIANAGTSRLDELKTTVREIVEGDPVDRNWSLITFAGCSGVSVKGTFSKAERPGLIGLVEKLKARPSTPLAKALESALRHARSSGDHSAALVLVTDGRDTCRGDPCAVAQAAGRDVPVHVVTIGQATQHACIAEATGGQLFTSVRGADLREVLSSAVRTATPEGC